MLFNDAITFVGTRDMWCTLSSYFSSNECHAYMIKYALNSDIRQQMLLYLLPLYQEFVTHVLNIKYDKHTEHIIISKNKKIVSYVWHESKLCSML